MKSPLVVLLLGLFEEVRGQIYPCHVKIFLQKVENWIFAGPWHPHQRPEGLSICCSERKIYGTYDGFQDSWISKNRTGHFYKIFFVLFQGFVDFNLERIEEKVLEDSP